MADDFQAVEAWPCRSCGMSLRDCTEEPDPLGVCCAVCGQAARGNHGEYEWRPTLVVAPESAKHPCRNQQPHPAHDWIEQTGEIDYEHYWCIGVRAASCPQDAKGGSHA